MEKLKDIHKFRNIHSSNDFFGGGDLLKDYFYISVIFDNINWEIFNHLEFLIGHRYKKNDNL
jgi:hypothetical protein